MNYVNTVNLLCQILFIVFGLFYAHFAIFAIIGIFAKKRFPKAKTQHKYGILVSARNEEYVIGNLIKSIQKSNYPQDKLKIFIIAHNCTDKTAEISRSLGANVYEYNNPNERTKGFALKYLVEQIRNDHGLENFDGFFVFDADNIVSKDYFDKMNDAFEFNNGQKCITSYRNSKNYNQNLISGLYGMFFMISNCFELRGRVAANCSSRIGGTGYLMPTETIKNGWNYTSLTEDWELTADEIIKNRKIDYCDDAVFYDEQPTSFKVMWRQRVRWQKGHQMVFKTRMLDLIKSFFGPKEKHRHKTSIYDIAMVIMPFCIIFLSLNILQIVLLLLAPIFGAPLWPTLLNWLAGLGFSFIGTYATLFLSAAFVFILENKRTKHVKWYKKLMICLAWPLFLALQIPIEVVALFSRNLAWKTIPHNNTTSLEDLSDEDIELSANEEKTIIIEKEDTSVDNENSEV